MDWVAAYYHTDDILVRKQLVGWLDFFMRTASPMEQYAADCYISDHALPLTVAMLEMQGLLA